MAIKAIGWKNNSKMLGGGVLIAFILIIFIIERGLVTEEKNIRRNRKTVEAVTVDCFKNIKSSMHNVTYKFYYNSLIYSGTEKFDKVKRGDICKGFHFLVEFDSLNPMSNRIMLDSIVR